MRLGLADGSRHPLTPISPNTKPQQRIASANFAYFSLPLTPFSSTFSSSSFSSPSRLQGWRQLRNWRNKEIFNIQDWAKFWQIESNWGWKTNGFKQGGKSETVRWRQIWFGRLCPASRQQIQLSEIQLWRPNINCGAQNFSSGAQEFSFGAQNPALVPKNPALVPSSFTGVAWWVLLIW